jgi:hypothetical protein
MPNSQSGGPRKFQVLCSATAAAELREAECQEIIRSDRHSLLFCQEFPTAA